MLRDDSYFYELLTKLGMTDDGATLLEKPLKIAIVVVVAIIAARLGARLAKRIVNSIGTQSALYIASPRAEQRMQTIGGVAASLVRIAVWAIAVMYTFDLLEFNLGPLIAGASIIGVALGFGAQSIVRDFLSGFFILVEDQYGVGDVVTVADKVTGTIEEVNLRVTRLRSVDGTVWFVPNGEIRTVGNAAREWARALVDVVLPYSADSTAALAAITEEAEAFSRDPDWSAALIEPPEVWGVESIEATGLTVRVAVKTDASRRPAVARVLRGRIGERLRRDGIIVDTATPTTPA
jgi:small conductance mechanosensitive channel